MAVPVMKTLSQSTPIHGSKKKTFITFTDSEGQGFGQSPEGPKAYLCSARSGTSAGRLEGWGLESPLWWVVLAVSWASTPFHAVSAHEQVWASSHDGSWV